MCTLNDYQFKFYDLPLCRLHVVEAGNGPPLIIVPATISECRDWIPLTRFMSHWFHVYFFELPGHGESSPFNRHFSTDLVAATVEELVNALGIKNFSVMGFSFGGILTIKTFNRLRERVDNVILISPCLTRDAVMLSPIRIRMVLFVNRIIGQPLIRRAFLSLLHNPKTVNMGFRFLQKIGRLESTIELRPKLLTLRESTLEVLSSQIKEILTIRFPLPKVKHNTPCFLWMSVNDPVLDFQTTLDVAQEHFARVEIVRSYMPYHQPPEPFTYEGLNRDYYETVGGFLTGGFGSQKIK